MGDWMINSPRPFARTFPGTSVGWGQSIDKFQPSHGSKHGRKASAHFYGPSLAGNIHSPDLGPFFKVFPFELTRPFRVELVKEGDGVVVVDELKGFAGGQAIEGAKYGRMFLPRWNGPNIQNF